MIILVVVVHGDIIFSVTFTYTEPDRLLENHIHTNSHEEKSDDLESTPKDGPFRRLELVSRSKCSSSRSNGINDSNRDDYVCKKPLV